jgi:hypothetical protein
MDYAKPYYPHLLAFLKEQEKQVFSLETLSRAITEIVNHTQKKVVVLIDEVDKSSNNQLFISFLAMFRNKFLSRETAATFHSIVLAGVHDVKSLKLKIRPELEQKFNSPWNIASEYTVDLNLYPAEIKPMLDEYAKDRGVEMDTKKIADCLFYYTSGYPFLVSKLCKMFDERYLPEKGERAWTEADIETAVQEMLLEHNTNFDTQTKNIENNPELYDYVYRIAVQGESIPFSVYNPTFNYGILYGILVNNNGLKIHNRIYKELLIDYMTTKTLAHEMRGKDTGAGYKNANNTLNMEAVLQGFQTFMKKEYSKKDRDFLEKNGRLVFLAFIKPIINGSGYDFKETQISEERRLDVVITYLHEKFVAELKLWRGEKAPSVRQLGLFCYLFCSDLSRAFFYTA